MTERELSRRADEFWRAAEAAYAQTGAPALYQRLRATVAQVSAVPYSALQEARTALRSRRDGLARAYSRADAERVLVAVVDDNDGELAARVAAAELLLADDVPVVAPTAKCETVTVQSKSAPSYEECLNILRGA